ncbi:Polyhedrin [Trichinella spiralis]|uniref:Polyhedrin n=1 Tax=Trichinella spiralis TaxID=6334 RepID=A0ABR3KXE0_TRISP
MILVYQHPQFKGNPSVKCTQPYVRIEFGRYQRSAYFFPITRGQLDSLCISVNVPWNSEMILRRLRPEFLEDSFMMAPAAYEITDISHQVTSF